MKERRSSLKTGEGDLDFLITHRPRITRRMHLELNAEGELVVVVPTDWPVFYTRRVLRKNLPFVRRFLSRSRARQTTPLRYEDGSSHLFAGEPLNLSVQTTQRPWGQQERQQSQRRSRVQLEGSTLEIRLNNPSPERVRKLLRAWYREQAETRFACRLEAIAKSVPWAKNRSLTLALRRMKRTWGTCSSAGVIRLNTHLVKAPQACLDYVIAHELCHLQEMNHGPRFYALQEQVWPEWRRERQHLRDYGNRYTQE